MKYISPLFMLVILLSYGCTTTEKATKDEEDTATPSAEETVIRENIISSEFQQLLDGQRSSLYDLFTTQNHDLPAFFFEEDTSSSAMNSDPSAGYRIQILSTRSVQEADSVAGKFREWSSTEIPEYYPRTYVFFSQPFYKVHVGDFQEQNQANNFSKLVKKQYPGAWVVPDQIEPDMVPSDTLNFNP